MQALFFTNIVDDIIFADQTFLDMLHQTTDNIIGKPMYQVLGVEADIVAPITQQVAEVGSGKIDNLTVLDAKRNPVAVKMTGLAHYDNEHNFLGGDYHLQQIDDTLTQHHYELEIQQLKHTQIYFVAQIEELSKLLNKFGGRKLTNNLQHIFNETSEYNDWTVQMQSGKVMLNTQDTDITAYQAILSRAIGYGIQVIGKSRVKKSFEKIEQRLESEITEHANILNLERLLDD